ncbi:ankyrin repeat domain-containing protein [Gammaproteobacteria bacterium]|nr:ankyrin repeat domain-containing protein [Gammaproteobacteria bacterium]
MLKELEARFQEAVLKNNIQEVILCIERGADSGTLIKYSYTTGDMDKIENTSALLYAARRGKTELLKILLERVKYTQDELDKALSDSLLNKCSITDVKAILAAGADPNKKLLSAIEYKHSQYAIAMFNEGADYDGNVTLTSPGTTPLMVAIRSHKLGIVKWLLEKNVRVDLEDKEGKTALKVAFDSVESGYIIGDAQSHQRCISSHEIVEMLLAYHHKPTFKELCSDAMSIMRYILVPKLPKIEMQQLMKPPVIASVLIGATAIYYGYSSQSAENMLEDTPSLS